jgi:hypothetical protein
VDPVDRRNLRITGQHPRVTGQHLVVQPHDVTVIVTQAYGPRGDNLVGISDVQFDGHPAVTIKIRTPDGHEGLVHLSPLHGDARKMKPFDIAHGTRLELLCPVSGQPLDYVGDVEDQSGAKYFAIYLTPQLSRGTMVMVSDVWGHYHSRIVDDFELISAWAANHND